jgi:hypothetical protein
MRSLGSILLPQAGNQAPRAPSGEKYRSGAVYVMDPLGASTKLDRNQRAKLLAIAESIERRTKSKGRKSGLLGLTGLQVLRVLLLKFHNSVHGLCCPSIEKLREVTGFCKQTVVKAIRALEAVGILKVTRRLVKRMVERNGVMVRATVQASNLYAFKLGGRIELGPLLVGRAKSFPPRNALISFLFQPGLRNREQSHTRVFQTCVPAS